jgi:hypothetical protein
MADYYPLVAKAVAGLEKNTGEGRRALYERARTALVAQLRGMDPPLTESEITRERLALEEAIRKAEAESARRMRDPAPAKPPERPRADETAWTEPKPTAPSRDPAKSGDAPAGQSSAQALRARFAERQPLVDSGLKGFRDVIAEAEGLGEATAQASKTAREAYAAMPPPSHQFDRLEPRVEPEGLRTPVRPAPPPRPLEAERMPEPRAAQPRAYEGDDETYERTIEPRPQRPIRRRSDDDELEVTPKRSRAGLVVALLAVLIIIAGAATAFWQRDRVAALFNAVRGPVATTPKDVTPTRPKITDRVGQADPQTASPAQPSTATPVAAVAQRVVLYEEDPSDPQGKRYVGSAIWRTETVSPGPGQPAEAAVRADLEVPERRITMTFSLRRNTDQALPASHTIEILFNLPADFPFGGISNVPGILMKQAEQTRGAPLAGLAVKVTSGFFLVGLSAVESDMQRNIQLLKERSWFDIPIVYNNGRRAILAIEKGNPGERAFATVFTAWGQ